MGVILVLAAVFVIGRGAGEDAAEDTVTGSPMENPEAGEVGSCTPYLHEQLRIIRPKMIIALGRVSGQILSGKRMSMKNLRGQFYEYRGIPLLPTYHPAYLLRQREREGRGNIADRNTWADLQKAMAFLADEK